MEKQIKAWVRPELIVLVRSKPEEAILTACKDHTVGPGNANAWCAPVGSCPPMCNTYTAS